MLKIGWKLTCNKEKKLLKIIENLIKNRQKRVKSAQNDQKSRKIVEKWVKISRKRIKSTEHWIFLMDESRSKW